MNITNQNLFLNINNIIFSNYYLINSDTLYELQEEKMSFMPTSMNNDRIPTRILEKIKLEFAIMASNRSECIENFKNLLNLIDKIIPKYTYVGNQYLPKDENFNGLLTLSFKGMPKDRETIKLHLTEFSYSFDKDLGFIRVPKSEIIKGLSTTESKAIPISYIINMSGNIILPIAKTTYMYVPTND